MCAHKYKQPTAVYEIIKKYGLENIKQEILHTVTARTKKNAISKLNPLERFYIKEFDTMSPNGYNLTEGGINCVPTEATRKKLRKKKSATTRHRMSVARKKLLKEHPEMNPMKRPEVVEKQNEHKYKAVVRSDGKWFKSATHASKKKPKTFKSVETYRRAIAACCAGERKTAGDYGWTYAQKQTT